MTKKSYPHLLVGMLMIIVMAAITSCEDILGEWSKPAPNPVVPEPEPEPETPVKLTSITLNKPNTTLNVGATETLTVATVAPDDATDKTVTWSSDKDAVATVDDNGLVTAVAVGTAIITATAKDGSGVTDKCTVTVSVPGLLTGEFSVAADKKVRFAQGNLQYQASTSTWRFADHQYDYVGNAVGNTTSTGRDTQADWIDLFGWGTAGHSFASGYGTAYQPWARSPTKTDYGPTGTSSLTGTYVQGDWGTNAISNGGNTPNSGWRTLTQAEWTHLFNGRTSVATRYCKATVNSKTGVVLFPDSYTHPDGVAAINSANTTNAACTTNSWSSDDWTKMESAGCVFLPAAGFHNNTTVDGDGTYGSYWSSTVYDANKAYGLNFKPDGTLLNPAYDNDRFYGVSVRLVRPVE